MKPPVTAIIQARMSSSRLPGKVLRQIGSHPMLAWVVERARLAHNLDSIIVATTTDPTDDLLAAFCEEQGYPCFRGSLYDVLDRYYQAAQAFHLASDGIIVRITADCPMVDPALIDEIVERFITAPAPGYDFAANRLPEPWGRTYPIGLDLELCTVQALETAWKEAQEPHQREHVMPFFYEHPERFRILHLNYPLDYGKLRWTVDTIEDLDLLQQIVARFPGRQDFSWLEVLDLFQRHPDLAEFNARVQHKFYRQVDHRRQ